MSGWNNSVSRGARIAEGALWSGAGLIVLTAYVGAALWLLCEQPIVASDNMPPAAIMIELAETPEAMMTEENEITPDQQTSEAVQPAEKVDTAQQTLPDESPPDEQPVEEAVPVEPGPVEKQTVAELDKVEVPLPVVKPKLPEKKLPEKKPEQTKPELQKKTITPPRRERAASKQAVQAQAQVTQSSRNAGRQTASGLFASQTPAKWQSRLMAHLERRKKYPAGAKSRGERGVALVRFSIDDGGNVLSVSLARSSGFPELDQEVLSLVRRASPVPAPPPDAKKTITAPVRFDVR